MILKKLLLCQKTIKKIGKMRTLLLSCSNKIIFIFIFPSGASLHFQNQHKTADLKICPSRNIHMFPKGKYFNVWDSKRTITFNFSPVPQSCNPQRLIDD